jgi:putative ATPase
LVDSQRQVAILGARYAPAGETYLPEGMENPGWYQPVPRGLEIKIAEKIAFLRQLDQQARDAEAS